jgi:NCAIR mutase (PurE)-related protein
MNQEQTKNLLRRVQRGAVTISEAVEQLSRLATADLGFAKIDHHRLLRRGMPEVIFATGKQPRQIKRLVSHHVARKSSVLVTRLELALGEELTRTHPGGDYDFVARTFTWRARTTKPRVRGLVVVSAGTSDLPVAREAINCAEAFGMHAEHIADVGVAGLHRLLDQLDRLRRARCLVVVAGMEGALPSVVTGLVACPVIGVPTSVGYGVARGGLAALFGMLTSCAGGLTVVNIDNGFGAACAAHSILVSRAKTKPRRRR